MAINDSVLADYFLEELEYLRHSGKRFSQDHPKVAARLALNDNQSVDPHVERLLESFAFLTARLKHSLDEHYPEIATALLDVLYPHLLQPVPSMGIAQFLPLSNKVMEGYNIERHTQLFAHAEQDIICRFRTVYPLTLWPIEITNVRYTPAEVIDFQGRGTDASWFVEIKLSSQGVNFDQLNISNLRFHIKGMVSYVLTLYENIMTHKSQRAWVASKGAGNKLSAQPLEFGSIKPVGFSPQEVSLPLPAHNLHGQLLLQEFFHFQDKFMFFEVDNLEILKQFPVTELSILIPLRNGKILAERNISTDNIALNCVPVVNLFSKTTDPLRIDHMKSQYRLVPDQRRERTTEIYQILDVHANLEQEGKTAKLAPYYSYSHHQSENNNEILWIARRESAQSRNLPGTDIYLSFVNRGFQPQLPDFPVIYAHTLCTNRYLAKQLHANAALQAEENIPVKSIYFVDHVVDQAYPNHQGQNLWRLISQLAVNHLSIASGHEAINALRELLHIYTSFYPFRDWKLSSDLHSIHTKPIVRRIGKQAWRGFVQGMEVTLEMTKRNNTNVSNFLLGAVLREYLSLQIHANSFLELVLYDPDQHQEWMRWKPSIGNIGII